jgi:hypothetical protein
VTVTPLFTIVIYGAIFEWRRMCTTLIMLSCRCRSITRWSVVWLCISQVAQNTKQHPVSIRRTRSSILYLYAEHESASCIYTQNTNQHPVSIRWQCVWVLNILYRSCWCCSVMRLNSVWRLKCTSCCELDVAGAMVFWGTRFLLWNRCCWCDGVLRLKYAYCYCEQMLLVQLVNRCYWCDLWIDVDGATVFWGWSMLIVIVNRCCWCNLWIDVVGATCE